MGFFSKKKNTAAPAQQAVAAPEPEPVGTKISATSSAGQDGYLEWGDAAPPNVGTTAKPALDLAAGGEEEGAANGTPSTTAVQDGYVKVEDDAVIVGTKQPFNGVKGTVQPARYKDLSFAILFMVHVAGILFVFVSSHLPNAGGLGNSYLGVATFVSLCAVFGIALTFFTYRYMLEHSETTLKTTMFVSVVMFILVGTIGLVFGEFLMSLMGVGGFLFGIVYANSVRNNIPFTASNVSTAIHAVKQNKGIFMTSLLVALLGVAWTTVLTISGVYAYDYLGKGTLAIFLFSYYWVHQSLQAVMQVTTASLIGTWWEFPDEEISSVSLGLSKSFNQAMTCSFGSICTGGLLFSFVQALRQTRWWLQNKIPILSSAIDCLLDTILSVFEFVNEWAYVYIGLYGYSYSEAGKNVATMLQNKGWSGVISSDLASNALLMTNLSIGLMTGFFGLVLGFLDKKFLQAIGLQKNYDSAGFIIGFLVGFIVSSIILSVVSSALNSVVVLFAESPAKFKRNHPALSSRMETAWSEKFQQIRSQV